MIRCLLLTSVAMLLVGCESFETYECNEKYLHVYYGGGVGGHRTVVLNDHASMRFTSPDAVVAYTRDESPKLVFENDNPIAVSCETPIVFTTDAEPAVNTLGAAMRTEVVEPHQLIDLDDETYDIVIR